jgi:hypothetical protein
MMGVTVFTTKLTNTSLSVTLSIIKGYNLDCVGA